MRKMVYLVLLLLGSMVLAAGKYTSGGIREALLPEIVGYGMSDREIIQNQVQIDGRQNPNWLLGTVTYVATTSQNETSPAVANCSSGNFLAVYQKSGDIWGQLIAGNGALFGNPFVIYDGVNNSYYPKVSCNYGADTFVVVWEYDYKGDLSDLDVMAQAVYGDYRGGATQLQGLPINVSSDGSARESSPSISCNYLDSTCLVVFEYQVGNESDIYARRLASAGNGLSLHGDRFVISSVANVIEFYPVVTWGQYEDEFLVAWLYEYLGEFRVVYAMVHDMEQGIGAIEMKSSTTWLINPGSYGGAFDRDSAFLDIDYNPNSSRYLVTFVLDPSPKKVSPVNGLEDVLVGVLMYPGQIYMDPTYLAYYNSGIPAVTACKTPDTFTGVNEFLIGYSFDYSQDTNTQVMGMIVPDRRSETSQRPVFTVKSAQKNDAYFGVVDVTTKSSNGNYFVVWEQYNTLTAENDIYGQLISHGYYQYLPQVGGD